MKFFSENTQHFSRKALRFFRKEAALFLLILCTIGVSGACAQKNSRRFEINRNLDYFNLVFKNVDLFYVDTIDVERTIQTGIRSMLRSLDPYTEFFPEKESDEFKMLMSGNYGGIGSLIMLYKNGEICIAEPYEDQPAARFGLKAGDILLEIDGESLKGMTTAQVSERLRGPSGSTLKVKVRRPGEKEPLDFNIVRSSIQLPAIPYYKMYPGGVGYIYLGTFTGEPVKEFKAAFLDLKKQGITSLVIDLRNNTGGLLEAAVDIANFFLPKGQEIVTTRGKGQRVERTYKTSHTPLDTEIPIVVLVNGVSASASEILAGAFQDLDRAVIIGERTYGKGLVQTTRALPYGASMKVTTAKYYIPSGRCIQAIDYTKHESINYGDTIPDSLTHEFRTKSGRLVRDGGGIMPDIAAGQPEMSTFTFHISPEVDTMRNIFDFATQYCLEHKSIPTPDKFEISDEDYARFLSQLQERKFTYKLSSERLLKELKESLGREGYEAQAGEQISALEQLFKPDVERDAKAFEKEVKQLIEMEIVRRYYYQRGEMELLLRTDTMLPKAFELLADPDRYHALLRPGTPAAEAATAQK